MAGAKTILVVEDDATSREALVLILESEGHSVVTAGDGQQALDRLRAHPETDLVLLDLMLPRVSGWAFRERQREDPALANVPVVVVSALDPRAGRADDLGAAAYLEKPLDVAQLLRAVASATAAAPCEVLVVEGDPAVRRMLALSLPHYGLTVREAAGVAEALALYDRHRDTVGVVLLEVDLPGCDGPAALEALRRLDPGVRAVFMGGNFGEHPAEELLRRGAAAVLQKPFTSMEQLARRLREAATR